MRLWIATVLASGFVSPLLCERTYSAEPHHKLATANAIDGFETEPRREIHIIENANLKHIFRINRATGEVSECDYNLEGKLEGCATPGYGAVPEKSGDYALENADLATAVYRVELKTGAKTICALGDGRVYCVAAVDY